MKYALRIETPARRQSPAPARLLVEPDWFLYDAAGITVPRHPGETRAEYRARKERTMKVWHVGLLVVAVLLGVGIAIGVWVNP